MSIVLWTLLQRPWLSSDHQIKQLYRQPLNNWPRADQIRYISSCANVYTEISRALGLAVTASLQKKPIQCMEYSTQQLVVATGDLQMDSHPGLSCRLCAPLTFSHPHCM